MTDITIGQRAAITPTTPEDMVGRWIISRDKQGTLTTFQIVRAQFEYVPGFAASDLQNTEPASLTWQAVSSELDVIGASGFAFGTRLLLAESDEVDIWIDEHVARRRTRATIDSQGWPASDLGPLNQAIDAAAERLRTQAAEQSEMTAQWRRA